MQLLQKYIAFYQINFLEIGAVSAIAATALFCLARLPLDLLPMLSLTLHLPER